jgi:hypothetical protein
VIVEHSLNSRKQLELKLCWFSGESTWAVFHLVKKDVPYILAQQTMDKDIKQHMRWAHLTLRTIKHAIHQIQHIPSNPDHALLPEYQKSLPTKACI